MEYIAIGLILVTTLPVLYKLFFGKKKSPTWKLVRKATKKNSLLIRNKIMSKANYGIFSLPVIVAALGYFVDIYDLLLFTIVREPSMSGSWVQQMQAMLAASTKIINWQMVGLADRRNRLGVLGDKKGRLSVLFGSIILYSVANFITGFVQNNRSICCCQICCRIGLAGELGAGITLVSELLPKNKRGIGTSLVAGIGLFGAVFAYFTFKFTDDWRFVIK